MGNIISHSIIPALGTVSINVTPDTASWSFTDGSGETHSGSGDKTLQNIPAGNIALTWATLSLFSLPTPNPETKALVKDQTVTFTGVYARESGTVAIQVTPAGAPWSFTDGDGQTHNGTGPQTMSDVPTGQITLTWGDLSGYIRPANPNLQVLAKDATITFSAAYAVNRPPNAPTLVSPVNGAQNVGLTPVLQAGAYSDLDGDAQISGAWQVATDSAFTNIVWESGGTNTTQTSLTVPAGKLTQYKRYWWRARYKDNRGTWGYWPTAFSFDTGNRPPNAPTLVSPVNGAQNVSLTPTLQIGPFSDPDTGDSAVAVEFQVASDSGFVTIVKASGGITPTLSWTVPASYLAQYKRYWWRARYKDNRGTWGYWPIAFSFDTGNRPPNAPTLVSPLNNAQNVSVTPLLQIGAFSDPDGDSAASIEFQVASDSAFATIVVASGGMTPTQSWTVPASKLAQYKRYWWRARYKDNRGTWGYWPTAFSFDTGNRPPNAPLLSSPAKGALNVGLTPALKTGAYSDPDGDLQTSGAWQVATDSAFATIVWDSGGTNTTQISLTVPAGKLQANKLYYWHVRYKDNRGTWGYWSATWSFNTGTSKAKADSGDNIAISEEVLPLSIEASPGNVVGPMSRLAIRLTAVRTIDPASLRVYLDGPNGWTAQSSQWWPVDVVEGVDGWAVYVPETPMPTGRIQATAVAYTILGEPLESVLQTFEVDATHQAGATGEVLLLAVDDVSLLPETAGVPLSSAYRIAPTGAFATPVTLQVPLDKACAPEDVEIYYFSESALHQGWYPAADVTGWLVSETAQVVNDKGNIYLELQVNHSGIFQLVTIKK